MVGSLQCTSSYTISTGCRAHRPSTCAVSAVSVFSLRFCGREVERRITLASGNREQVGEQRRNPAEIIGRLRQQSFELVEPLFGRVVSAEAGGAFEVGDNRVKGAVLMVRRAKEAQAGVRLAGKPLHHGLSEARLADAGLAGDRARRAVAALCLLPASQQQLISSSRPTSGVVAVRSASNRLSTELGRSAAQARTGPSMPLSSLAPRS